LIVPRKAVLFDMDGVIVLSNPAHLATWQFFAAEKLGLKVTEELFFRYISGRKNEEALAALFPGRFSPEEATRLSNEKEACYRERFGPTLEPVPGVLELIRDLSSPPTKREVVCALVTSAIAANAQYVLHRFGLQDAFAAIITGEEVEKAKPDPTIYLLGASRVGAAPDDCLVLEDAYAGVLAAKRAGMTCVAVTTSEPEERLMKAGADVILPDFRGVDWSYLRTVIMS